MQRSSRMFLLAFGDILCIFLAGLLGSVLILSNGVSLSYVAQWTSLALIVLPAQVAINYFTGLYSRVWRYASVGELINVLKASSAGSVAFAVAVVARHGLELDRMRVVPLYWLLTTGVLGGLRFAVRLRRELSTERSRKGVSSLIVGAGDAGYMLLREIEKHRELNIKPIGLVDDDPTKQGLRMVDVPVLGTLDRIKFLATEYEVEQVILAIPSAQPETVRRVVEMCAEIGVPLRTMPGIYEIVQGSVAVSRIREVQIEDLLHRDEVKANAKDIGAYISSKRVLVTGAGGSIGSELCRQILRCGPAELYLLGHGENSIFAIHRELVATGTEVPLIPLIADVQSVQRIRSLFRRHKPEVVFHAAAHKHVPLMETNSVEAIRNNVWGTTNVVEAAMEACTERFVLISTDKAVNPSSVMGATKRAAELVIQKRQGRCGTKLMAVRFGNVLGSRGSVVPIFKEQIANGGPVKVTHPDMERYFMTIPEAVSLVLQAGSMGKGGELFVLDMGTPVKVLDMARDLITLSGFRPEVDIKIEFTGIRPGEKLYEELLTAEEGTMVTSFKKIMVARQSQVDPKDIDAMIDKLSAMVDAGEADNAELIKLVQDTAMSGARERAANGAMGGNGGAMAEQQLSDGDSVA